MTSITKIFEWDMGHRIPHHKSLCKNPHGHRYKMTVTISGPINNQPNSPLQGMIIDFGDIKAAINEELVSKLDHAFMYWEDDKIMSVFAENNPSLKLVKMAFIPTAECIAEYLSAEIAKLLSNQFPGIKLDGVTLYETPTSFATVEGL